jgi:nitroimidazol reductase NimA-like FMN-containing flavoprotein (pyridoxamine 5'-phosphate oxidase superfamily)
MSYTMSRKEREAYLADVHVAVLSIPTEGRGPLSAPVWYGYEPGREVWFCTGRDSRKGKLLRDGVQVSLCVQTETAPYKYVTVEGPVTSIAPSDIEADLRPLARRYLGDEGGDRYVESTADTQGGGIRVAMRPSRWLSVDYGKRG